MSLNIQEELKNLNNEEYKTVLQRFFKTGKGQYGEGDVFLGLKSEPLTRTAKKYLSLGFNELQELLEDEIHECRSAALVILKEQFKKGDERKRKEIFQFYLNNTRNINNWDLVDCSAPQIVGIHLLDQDRKILYRLAKSKNLWEKRIAMISTFSFIRNQEFEDTLKIAEILLNDKHDLIHKAVGWMLRELGKRDQAVEEIFLKKYYNTMPRTMLRYSIERFEETKRQKYLKGLI